MITYENVESPVSYDFWCAVWLLSNAIGRRITVARPQAPVYLNLYAVLCAEAGITRKSTAVRQATDMLREYAQAHDPAIAVLAGTVTTTSLSETLVRQTAVHGRSHVAISASELVTLLGKDRGSIGLPAKLTDLYDCPAFHTRTVGIDATYVSRENYLSLLGASTPSWLLRSINPNVIEGGFTSRCLFILEDKPKKLVAWPEEHEDDTRYRRLLDGMSHIRDGADYAARRAGGIRLTKIARQQFTDWYEQRSASNDAYGASFQAREDHHILRLSGIMAAADGRWEIDEHHITHATLAIMYTKYTSAALFTSGMAASKTYALVDRIRSVLVAAGRSGLSQAALTGVCRKHGTPTEQSAVLSVMHEMLLIQKFSVEGTGRPVTMYRATKALARGQVLEDIVDVLLPQEEV